MWEALLIGLAAQLASKYGMAVAEPLAKALVESFEAVVLAVKRQALAPDVVEYAFRLAAGVIADNPTMRPGLQQELIVDGIRLLLLDPAVRKPADPLAVNALAALALARAGFSADAAPDPQPA